MSASTDSSSVSHKSSIDKPSLLTPNSFYSCDDKPELWIEPDVVPHVPATTGYPQDVPPPQRMLPKIRRNRKHYPSVARGNLTEKDAMRFYKLHTDLMKPQIINERHGKAHVPKIIGAGLLDLRPVNTDSGAGAGADDSNPEQEETVRSVAEEASSHGNLEPELLLGVFVPFSNYIGCVKPNPNNKSGDKASRLQGSDSPSFSPTPTLPVTLPPAFQESYGQNSQDEDDDDDENNHQNSKDKHDENDQTVGGSPSPSKAASGKKNKIALASPSPEDDDEYLYTHILNFKTGTAKPSKANAEKPSTQANAKKTKAPATARKSKSAGKVASTTGRKKSNDQTTVGSSKSKNKNLHDSSPDMVTVVTQASSSKSKPSTASVSADASDHETANKRAVEETAAANTKKPRQKKRKTESEQKVEQKHEQEPEPVSAVSNILSGPQDVDDGAANDDFCSTCHGVGHFLCCEGCPKSFHFTCLDPPLEESSLPEGQWFCRECIVKRGLPNPYKRGLFSQLLRYIDTHNPVQFALPKNIGQRFERVISNEHCDYADSEIKVYRSARNGLEDSCSYRLIDKRGNPIFCYKCKQSSLSGGPIAQCQHCPLNWHFDCLNPPMPSVKSPGVKWKCPNHSNHSFKKKRGSKSAKNVDSDLDRALLNSRNVNNSFQALHSSEDEEYPEPRAPLFDYIDTPTGVSATVPASIIKPLIQNGVVYRIPEHGVKLDFIQRVRELNEEAYQDTRNSDILLALDELVLRDHREKQTVQALTYLKTDQNQEAHIVDTRANLETLIDAALGFSKGIERDTTSCGSSGSSGSISTNTSNSSNSTADTATKDLEPKIKSETSVSQRSARRASQIAATKIQAAAEEGRHQNGRRSSARHSADNTTGSSGTDNGTDIGDSNNNSAYTYNSNNSTDSHGSNSITHNTRSTRLRSAGLPGGSDQAVPDDHISAEERARLLAIQKLMQLKGKDILMDFLLPRVE